MTIQTGLDNTQGLPKRILSIDGGGIRCVMACEMLLELETQVRRVTGRAHSTLSDHFDLVAGTSGGALLATAIATGRPMSEVRGFLFANASKMLKPAPIYRKYRALYDKALFEKSLQEFYGENTRLGTNKLRTLLLMVLRNRTTDSPWLISNNPNAKFNQPELDDCNLNVPLWQLAKASAAAPGYFTPQKIVFGNKNKYEFVFVDGALTGFLNPSFKAFQYVTNSAYGLNWRATEETLSLISIGSGDMRFKRPGKNAGDVNVLKSLASFPNTMMYATNREQDVLCRTFGRCINGGSIDVEVGDMKSIECALEPRLFRYHRVNPVISTEGLESIGCGHVRAKDIAPIDSAKYIQQLSEVGRAMKTYVQEIVATEWNR